MSTESGRMFGRGLAFPPRVGGDGRVAWSEGELNVRESIQVILLTERRERLMLPEFGGGLSGYLFEPNTVTTRRLIKDRIQRALEQWEPRISVESVEVEADPVDSQAAVATITYQLVATQTRERVRLGVTLAG
ncbi:MAG TPA: GPW/gp25 family protein [Pyrinomonadaceae bacterium]|nr:GPW/gp25 family protein [Pyrinomonadaceae bacterium]